jgi:hypothetical protein
MSETSVDFYHNTWRNIQKTFTTRHRENLKYHILGLFSNALHLNSFISSNQMMIWVADLVNIREESWPTSRHNPSIGMERQRTATRNLRVASNTHKFWNL